MAATAVVLTLKRLKVHTHGPGDLTPSLGSDPQRTATWWLDSCEFIGVRKRTLSV